MKKALQLHSEESLESGRRASAREVLEFLDDFRALQAQALAGARPAKSILISMKVPEPLLSAFKARAKQEGKPYQTLIKELMRDWLSEG